MDETSTAPAGPNRERQFGLLESKPRLCIGSRREFLWQMGAGFAGVALTALLDQDGFFGSRACAAAPVAAGPEPGEGKVGRRAKSCIFLFMYGGPSQMDLFDYKPELNKRHGQTANLEQRRRAVAAGKLLGSKRTFKQHGQSGQWCSDALPQLATQMDKLAVIKSLYSDSFAHGSAMLQMNSGRIIQGWPSMGS